ncbi:hypothetical protein EVAR_13846_1 [Eumeta japonica]|uniref:Uncharacterized protein n=1 Tax=Eumeta variegata TaxID=151549 RepID=A0A4C1U1Y8_EUMVA|nr:hypothetical protein EVAR_13846_1 [Eumeta japonica]
MLLDFPLRAINLFNAAIEASFVSSVTCSIGIKNSMVVLALPHSPTDPVVRKVGGALSPYNRSMDTVGALDRCVGASPPPPPPGAKGECIKGRRLGRRGDVRLVRLLHRGASE